jgi:hypothetical protein
METIARASEDSVLWSGRVKLVAAQLPPPADCGDDEDGDAPDTVKVAQVSFAEVLERALAAENRSPQLLD